MFLLRLNRERRLRLSATPGRQRGRSFPCSCVFYDVQKGAIKIDGVDIKDMDMAICVRAMELFCKIRFCLPARRRQYRLGTVRIQDDDVEKAAEDVNLA